MARKKNSASKKAQNENKPSAAESRTKQRTQGEEQTSPRVNPYEQMSARAMDAWREQLTAMLSSPKAWQDMGKTLEPLSQLFTQGMDLWLMMFEQTSRMAGAGGFAGTHGQTSRDQKSDAAPKSSAAGASPASALSGASAYAVAQLAARVADLEKRLDALSRSVAASSAAGGGARSTAAQPAKPAASRRKGKAKVIALRPTGTNG